MMQFSKCDVYVTKLPEAPGVGVQGPTLLSQNGSALSKAPLFLSSLSVQCSFLAYLLSQAYEDARHQYESTHIHTPTVLRC